MQRARVRNRTSETCPSGLLSPWCNRTNGPHRSDRGHPFTGRGTLGALSSRQVGLERGLSKVAQIIPGSAGDRKRLYPMRCEEMRREQACGLLP
jgi:hypothetical protein